MIDWIEVLNGCFICEPFFVPPYFTHQAHSFFWILLPLIVFILSTILAALNIACERFYSS